MKSKLKLALASSFILCTGSSSAALIAYYGDGTDEDNFALLNLAGPSGATVTNLSTVGFPEGADGGNFTRPSFGVDTPVGPTAGSSAGSDWFFVRSTDGRGSSNTSPISTNDYFGFTVTAIGTDTIDLNSLAFDLVAVSNDATEIEALAQAFINVDGSGFVAIGPEFSATATNPTLNSHNFGTVTEAFIDLSSITGASSVEIRIGIADNEDTNSKATFYQGIQLDANIVPVPEPSSTALLGLGGLALILRRRK